MAGPAYRGKVHKSTLDYIESSMETISRDVNANFVSDAPSYIRHQSKIAYLDLVQRALHENTLDADGYIGRHLDAFAGGKDTTMLAPGTHASAVYRELRKLSDERYVERLRRVKDMSPLKD